MNTLSLKQVFAVLALVAFGVSPLVAPVRTEAFVLPPNRPETGLVFADKWSVTGPVNFTVDHRTATFTLAETEANPTAYLTQDTTDACLLYDGWEMGAPMSVSTACTLRAVTYARADIINTGNITGLPSGFVYVLRGSTIVQTVPLLVNGETPIQNYAWQAGQWVVLSTPEITIQQGDSVRFVLEQAERVGTVKNGRQAIFEKPGVFSSYSYNSIVHRVLARYQEHAATDRVPFLTSHNPLAAKQATCNSFQKTANRSTVWLVCSDGTRHAFLNPEIFFTWANSWNVVQVVSQAQLNTYKNYGYAPTNHRWMRLNRTNSSSTLYRQITNNGYVLTPVSQAEQNMNFPSVMSAYPSDMYFRFVLTENPAF